MQLVAERDPWKRILEKQKTNGKKREEALVPERKFTTSKGKGNGFHGKKDVPVPS